MTTTENTTRPSNNSITRRKMLQSVAVVSASVVLPAGAAAQASGTPFATPADVASPSASLLCLIDEHKWARDAWGNAGFVAGPELDAETAALEAILAHPIETTHDMHAKASYLLGYDHDEYESCMLEPLLSSMAGSEVKPRPQIADPLVEAIDAFRSGLAVYDALPSAIIERDEDRAIARTYGPPMDVLMTWDRPAQTLKGAIAAICMADDENKGYSGSVIAKNMVRAAFAYFSPRAVRGAPASSKDTPIQRLYEEWKAVREAGDHCDTDDAAQAQYRVYAALQEQITAMKPMSAKDMAAQLVVETDFGGSDYREVFFERVVALAEQA